MNLPTTTSVPFQKIPIYTKDEFDNAKAYKKVSEITRVLRVLALSMAAAHRLGGSANYAYRRLPVGRPPSPELTQWLLRSFSHYNWTQRFYCCLWRQLHKLTGKGFGAGIEGINFMATPKNVYGKGDRDNVDWKAAEEFLDFKPGSKWTCACFEYPPEPPPTMTPRRRPKLS